MPSTLAGSTQALVIRLKRQRSADVVISVLDGLARDGILRICNLEVLSSDDDRRPAVAIVVVEHLWAKRLNAALSEADAELIADPEPPNFRRRALPTADGLAQIQKLNELRRLGILTESEFAGAKRELLSANP
jgi:hypothetical protein